MSENSGSHTTNIFLGNNVMTEEELSRLAMGQATAGNGSRVAVTDTTTSTSENVATVHVVRHGKRGSHCLKVDPGSTINDVMAVLSVDTGDAGAWNMSTNTFSVRLDGGELNNECGGDYTFSEGTEHTLIVSPKVVGG